MRLMSGIKKKGTKNARIKSSQFGTRSLTVYGYWMVSSSSENRRLKPWTRSNPKNTPLHSVMVD